MTHCQMVRTNINIPVNAFAGSRRKFSRKKARRAMKKIAHFLGFLVFWGVAFALAELAFLLVMLIFLYLN